MLNAVEDRAREHGWLVISETATPGFVARITQQQLPRLLRDFDPAAVRRRITGLTAPLNVGSVAWDTIESHVIQAGLRNQIELLTDLLAEHGTGVLITAGRDPSEPNRRAARGRHHRPARLSGRPRSRVRRRRACGWRERRRQ